MALNSRDRSWKALPN